MTERATTYDGKGVAYIGLAATMITFLPAPEIQPLAKYGALLALAVSWFWEEPRIPVRKLRWLVNVGIGLCLIPPWLLYRETKELLLLFAYVVLLIDVGAAFQRTRGEDVARFYLIGALTLVAATGFETGLLFAVCSIVYAIALAAGTVLLAAGPSRTALSRHRRRASRRLVLATAGLCLLASTAAFAFAPRTGFGAFNTLGGGVRAIAGFTDEVSLNDFGRIQNNPAVVMRVRFPEGGTERIPKPMRWRGIGFDFFDGVRWSEQALGRGFHYRYPDGLQLFSDKSYFDESIVHDIRLEPTGTRYLLGLDWLTGIQFSEKDREFWKDAKANHNSNITYRLRPKPGFIYRAWASMDISPPAQLRARSSEYEAPIRRLYLQLPPDLDPRIAELTRKLVEGTTNSYDAAVAVERYLKENLRYTTVLPNRPPNEARLEQPLARFLFDDQAGHCEYFSSAMAIMLRTVGIPTRNVNGFLGADYNPYGDFYSVTQSHAHSWIEVYFNNGEWVPFDPTPPSDEGFGGAQFLADLRKYLDAARWELTDRWYSFVVTFDETDRAALLAALFRRLPTLAPFLLTLVVLLFGLLAYRVLGGRSWQRRRRGGKARRDVTSPDARKASRHYTRLLAKLARKGAPRRHGQGPTAFSEALTRQRHPDAEAVDRATRAYLEVRFGGAPLTSERKAALAPRLSS